ncbi:MAG: hypothetical protein U0805_21060 [Pirellulales bacterium]
MSDQDGGSDGRDAGDAIVVDGFSDENTCRKDFTPSEAAAMGMALEPLAKRKAKDRQGRPGKVRSEKVTEHNETGQTREQVGAAVGMSGPTYQRAKAEAGF